MKNAYRVLAYLLAAEVVINAMLMAYGIAALAKWVEDDNGVLNKALFDADKPDFPGINGFMFHGMNGMMVIPLIALALLVVSFFVKMAGATRRAAVLLGLVVLQVVLGLSAHGVPGLVTLHALNAFAIFSMAALAGYRAGMTTTAAHASAAPAQSSVSV